MIDRTKFFDSVRETLFNGSLSESQVTGLTAILDAWESSYGTQDVRWLSYCLSTAFHETARTMQPISEWGLGRGRPYGVADMQTGFAYYGRGYVQLTWKVNYEKMGEKLGIDLVSDPTLALVPTNAAAIMFQGMIDGDFTGKKLGNYFSESGEDPVDARRIINGTDCAQTIAGYFEHFKSAIVMEAAPEVVANEEPTAARATPPVVENVTPAEEPVS